MERGGALRFQAPVPLDRLIGRDHDAAAGRDLLLGSGIRLVTLVGPGGVGKTRLALRLASDLRYAFDDGVFFVQLAAITDPNLVLSSVRQAFAQVSDDAPPVESLRRAIGDRHLLIVLDNVEHLLASGPEVSELLAVCPGLKVLVTSRSPLHVVGEHVYRVRPLEIPSVGHEGTAAAMRDSPAVQLFLVRAQAAGAPVGDDDVPVVAEICRRVDGIPLGIELAAGRLAMLSPRILLARLDRRLPVLTGGPRNAPARHQTMWDAIAWSYDLLSPGEQALFRRLSVFAGGFGLESAVRLGRERASGVGYPFADGFGVEFPDARPWGRDPTTEEADAPLARELPPIPIDVEAGIGSLLAHCLLRRVDRTGDEALVVPRFEMLETIREFGVEQLVRAGEEEATRHAHAALMAALCEAAGLRLWVDGPRWRTLIDAELGNIRAALVWTQGKGAAGAELCLRIADPLWIYWQVRGLIGEGRRWLEGALGYPDVPEWARASALNEAGMLAWIQGDNRRAGELVDEAHGLWQPMGHRTGVARSLFYFAMIAWREGDFPRMVGCLEEAYPLFMGWHDLIGMSVCDLAMGVVARMSGQRDRALERFDAAFSLCEQSGYEWGAATARYYAGEIARDDGDLARAVDLLRDGLERYRAQGDSWGTGACVSALAMVAADRGEWAQSARLFGAGDALLAKVGAFLPPTELAAYAARANVVREMIGGDAFSAAYAAGRAMAADWVVADTNAIDLLLGKVAGESEPLFPDMPHKLTATEREVLELLVSGQSAREIADRRSRGLSTVYEVLARIREKLGTSTDAESAAVAVRRRLL